MTITMVGTGYVGLVTGACFAEYGVSVRCVDSDERKIALLKDGKIPIYEPGLDDVVRRNVAAGRLTFATDLGEAVRSSELLFIAVGTPQDPHHGRADISAVLAVAREMARHMTAYKLIVSKSTVPVGTGTMIRAAIEQHLPKPVEFSVASNPEFLREGSALEDFMHPDRIVVGVEDERAAELLRELYRPMVNNDHPLVVMDLASSELTKYASNAFLAVKISYINEMARLSEKVGADVTAIARGMGLDQRIGPQFLHPGPGFGGSCFPKDTNAIVATAHEHDVTLHVVEATVAVNVEQILQMVEKIDNAVGGVRGKRIGVLGLAFKPETDDVRESAALKVIRALTERGAIVRAYDPVAIVRAKEQLPDLDCGTDEYDVAKDADALALLTEWNQFRQLDLLRLKSLMRRPVFVDLRNVYDPAEVRAQGFSYASIGRP